jgi:hypothetical protein
VLLDPDGRRIHVLLKQAALATPATVAQLVARQEDAESVLLVLVADRIPEAARRTLTSHGWGWLDLRGHVHLSGHGLFVDADVPSARGRAKRTGAFSGAVGVEVACSLLLAPDVRHGVRGLARNLGRSPSTVSDVLSTLREQGLVASDGRPALPGLFWEVAGSWNSAEVALASLPHPGSGSASAALQLGFENISEQTGWALSGTLAAAAYGAPVAARSDFPPDFYIPDRATLQRAGRLLGVANDPGNRMASARVAPVPMICSERIDPAGSRISTEHWPLANPLFVALDLARDPGRGAEILDGWQPPAPWRKVW